MILTVTLLISFFKFLLMPAYRSTDFEVHRNWLAITHSLPLKQWYYEDTSQWTLDYPPLFAWFEYFLSFGAVLFDPKMLDIQRLNYSSDNAVLFQRLSVILTDFIYVLGVYKCCSTMPKGWRKEVVLPILMLANCGLIMVDHIHFQYNGIMYGLLLISIANLMQGKMLLSAFWFTILLNMKHIYIYLAPAYFIYLLKHYCLKGTSFKNLFSINFLKNLTVLGFTVIGVFLLTFLPFYQHIPQIISRLFPFKRGLCHAYWAPNFWAIYNIVDKALFIGASRLDPTTFKKNLTASMTGGLVQDIDHEILPDVTPLATMLLTIVLTIPAMVKLFSMSKQPGNFLRCLVICGLTSFMFGWHVHEKAILMPIIPLTILSIMESADAKMFLMLSTVGHYSLFPLLFPPSLLFVKVLLLLLYTLYAFHSLYKMYPLSICKYSLPLLNPFESIYLLGLSLVFLYENVIHNVLGLATRLPFLPLLITSVYCSLGVTYCWFRYYIYFLKFSEKFVKGKSNKQNKVE